MSAEIAQSLDFETFAPEECPFETVIVDVTHRCNMACHNCYVPNRTIPDLDSEWMTEIFSRLPRGRFIRFVGGEPTLRKDLPEMIARVRSLGHHPVLVTNGLKLADRDYLHSLKKAGLQLAYLSMNGAFDDDLYDEIDAMRCAEKKRKAFENLRAEHMFTSIGVIVVRGINERAVADLLAAVRKSRNVREYHIRSVGAIGRYMENEPYMLDDLLDLFTDAAGVTADSLERRVRTESSLDFTFGRLRVQLTQWPDLGSAVRGRLTPEGRVAPFFEHVIANEGGY